MTNRIPKDMMTIYSDRIKFAYGVYEIGSYADGEVELTLSLSQIESFLTDYGKELFARPQVEY